MKIGKGRSNSAKIQSGNPSKNHSKKNIYIIL